MIAFDTMPDVGTVVILDGQEYELAGSRPHTRANGQPTMLLVWETSCATCGVAMEVFTSRHTGPAIRRCPDHRKAGKPVKGRRGRKLKTEIIEP